MFFIELKSIQDFECSKSYSKVSLRKSSKQHKLGEQKKKITKKSLFATHKTKALLMPKGQENSKLFVLPE